ncbi:MAG: hypothetical protein C0467_01825 [Planctomycetaceae bacterium]|nr:hypothetical protein [Planctomycetaceae bacterium]
MIQTYSFSEAGGHPTNEDAFVVQVIPNTSDGWLVCIADGQGGRAGGAKAAQFACETAVSNVGRGGYHPDILTRADQAVAANHEAGFTTLVNFSVEGNCVNGASCGDSAVLAVCGSGVIAELTAQQFKNPPVGSGDAVFVPFEMELVRPWRVLAMTDGVWKYVGWQRVRELATKLGGEELLAALQSAARLPRTGQFQDDFTVVVLEAIE